jgi:hypothetical protein
LFRFFYRFFFFSFSSLPKKKVGGKLSPGVAEGRGSDQKVGPRAGDEAQGVVARLGVPIFEIFEMFFEGEEEREKREERGELGEKITGPRLSSKKTRRRRKNSSQKLKTHSQKWMLEWLKTSQWRSRLWKHCFGVEPEGESVSRRGRGLG